MRVHRSSKLMRAAAAAALLIGAAPIVLAHPALSLWLLASCFWCLFVAGATRPRRTRDA